MSEVGVSLFTQQYIRGYIHFTNIATSPVSGEGLHCSRCVGVGNTRRTESLWVRERGVAARGGERVGLVAQSVGASASEMCRVR